MPWMKLKMPRLPWGQLAQWAKWRPSGPVLKKAAVGAVAAAALCGAFCWGRYGGRTADAHASAPSVLENLKLMQTAQTPQSAQQIVAYVYDRPIYRWELGEYLIERFGGERIDFLVNRKIIEMACEANHIRISDAQIRAQLEEDLKGFGCTEADFVNKILRPRNKTLFEWKEDVIRPKLCLQEFVKGKIQVSEDDIQKGFEARYGPKVECRLIVLPKERAKMDAMWQELQANPSLFDKYAKEQYIQPLAQEGGRIPPIHKHFGDENIEKEAFRLQEGQISAILHLPDGSDVILRCEKHLPAASDVHLADVRMQLHKEIAEARLQVEIPKVFAALRDQANPRILIQRPAPPTSEQPVAMRQQAAQPAPQMQPATQPATQSGPRPEMPAPPPGAEQPAAQAPAQPQAGAALSGPR